MNFTVEQLYAAFAPLVGVDPVPPPAPVPAPAATPPPAGTAAPAPAAKAAAIPAPPPSPLQIMDPKVRGYHLDVTVKPDQVVAAAEIVTRFGYAIDTITGVDWMAAGQMEVVYDYFHYASPLHVVVRTRVPREHPKLPTISTVFPGANWHERETHDFFGIVFTGHPNLTPLLLPEDALFHPLRKDFAGVA